VRGAIAAEAGDREIHSSKYNACVRKHDQISNFILGIGGADEAPRGLTPSMPPLEGM
jgi:hypothetical protein